MTIPQFDLTRQFAGIEVEIQAALRRVLGTARFILGPEGEALERECASALGVAHTVGVGSGSDALLLILAGLGIGPGDEVITPAFSFVASATAVLQVGARPVFADVDPVTLTIAPDRVAEAITPRTRAIVAVHLYGLPAAMAPLRALAEPRGLALVEDAAQAFGSSLDGRPVGSLGVAAAFSFYPTKPLAAYGDAGLVATSDDGLASRLHRRRNHGQAQKYAHVELGWSSRLDELQAAILRVKLRHAPAWTEARRRIAARYTAALAGCPMVLPAEPDGARHVYHQYTVRTLRRDALAKHLADAGIGTACHYPQPIPGQPPFRALGWDPSAFPVSWRAAQEVLSLPCFPELTDPEVDAVAEAIRAFFEGGTWMRVLITGVTGFVGSHLADYLVARGDVDIYGTHRWRSRMENVEHLRGRIRLVECDLRDAGAVHRMMAAVRPHRVFHLAAQSYVPTSWLVPVETINGNITCQLNLFEAVRNLGLDTRFQIAGSSEEYGLVHKDEIPIREDNPLRPLSPYAVSKVAQDLAAYQYWRSYQLHAVRTRGFNHTGPRRGEVFMTSNLARQIAEGEKGLREPVVWVGNLNAIRDFTDVRDMVRAYWLALDRGEPGEVYNLCSGRGYTVRNVLEILLGLAQVRMEVREDSARLRPSDVEILLGDYSRFRQVTGWQPTIPFEVTLKDLLDYWRQRI